MNYSIYKDIIINNSAYRLLNKTAQSYLFCGVDSLALNYMARYFIEEDGGRTGDCADIMWLPASEKVLVTDIDFLTKTVLLTPVELQNKYYIIKNGETMNDAASNKLLKTLEEPNKKVKIIILAKDEFSVLSTIRSRCQIARLEPFLPAQLNEIADKFYGDSVNLVLGKELHLGSVTRLNKALNGGYNELLDLALNMLLFMKKSDKILVFAQKFTALSKDDFAELIGLIELIFYDCLVFLANQPINLMSKRADISKIAEFYGLEALIRMQEPVTKAKIRLTGMGNVNSITDELLFSLLSTRSRCTN